ncbi:hypothetical protein [Ralstonia phage phiRSL1]|uniref:Uncharacterized protein n=1 Tax=Ralstonia phage phiRSL1 TaxID=1980924 RepID=B2ZXZ5_9CAUD|nr:hypothetical protein RSL1_ORF137 [Ralstonia phage phiRSL1]BAG41582.1 hypothetical protein [Ralstonia phage phiRSL1]
MKYNRALDFLMTAAVKYAQGKPELAAKCMHKASLEPSFAHAIRILEASNAQAYQAQVTANAEAKAKVEAEAKEDEELEGLVGDADDMEDEEEAEEEVEAASEPEGEPGEVEDEALEIEEAEEAPHEKFAKLLASMKKPAKATAAATPAVAKKPVAAAKRAAK